MKPMPIALAVLGTALLFGLLMYSQMQTGPFHVSGFIEAEETRVGSRVGGRVKQVFAVEGEPVPDDGILLELEPFDLFERRAEAVARQAERRAEFDKLTTGFRQEEKDQAQAQVEQLEALVRKLHSGPRPEEIDSARNEAQEAEANYERAVSDFQRMEQLLGKGSVTRDQYELAAADLKAARATWDARRSRLALLEKGTREEEIDEAEAQLRAAQAAFALVNNGYRAEEIAQARAALEAADALVEQIERQIAELTVKGIAGQTVQAVDLYPGDLVGANTPVISLIDSNRLWVRAYVPENRLELRDGDKVSIRVDSFPEERFAGHIAFVSEEAEFTPRNIQTPEERSKQVFRIKVIIDEGTDRLRAGMAADVFLDSGT